jgi:hypothetical protein
MKTRLLFLESGLIACLLTSCAHVRQAEKAPPGHFPHLLETPGVVVVGSSVEIGRAGNWVVKITRFQAAQSTDSEWAVGVAGVYLPLQEIPPLIDGIARLLEVPLEIQGYDEVVARYTTRGGKLKISRSRQPGAVIGGAMQDTGVRYQLNESYTNDVNEIRRLKGLLEEAQRRLRTLE